MKDRNILIYFIPTFLLILSWLGIIFVRQFSLIRFESMSFYSGMFIFIFFLCFLTGTLLGPLLFSSVPLSKRPVYSRSSVNRNANYLLFFALISIMLLVAKFLSFIGDLSFSLADITELRLSRGRNSGEEKASTFTGILGMAMSGFTVIAFIYKDYFSQELTKKKNEQLYIAFWLGIFVSFLSGGRFAAMIAILIIAISHFLKKYTFKKHETEASVKKLRKRKRNGIFSKFFKFLLYVTVLYIFSMIFIQRAIGDEDNFRVLLDVLSNNFDGIELTADHKEFLLNNLSLIPLYFVISLFQYYIGHAFYQFDVLFSAPFPSNGPYFLTYQFYLHTTLLIKIGFDLPTINEILADLVNPGVYFTLAGAFLVDFGYVGSCLAIFIVAIIGSRYWVRYIRINGFFELYASILFLVLIIFSPIVAITGTGVYPSMLTLAFILKLFIPKKEKRIMHNPRALEENLIITN